MINPYINIATQAARSAGNIIVRAVDKLDKIQVREKNPNDFVTEIDLQSEREIINVIRKAYPHHSIVSEECGELSEYDSEYVWIIDPIDGTRNFLHGFPHFAISIALKVKGRIEHGIIYDPLRQELFSASRGRGAQLNERKIRVSPTKTLQQTLLATGAPHAENEKMVNAYFTSLQNILPICGDVRHTGSAALDLAYVASGRIDGFWEMGLQIWDIAAGILLIKESGGMVSDLKGGEDYLNSGNVLAANPKIFKSLLQHLHSSYADKNIES